MHDAVRNDVKIPTARPHAGSRAAFAAALRRLKRLGGDFGDAVGEILRDVEAAREMHPVISAYRRR